MSDIDDFDLAADAREGLLAYLGGFVDTKLLLGYRYNQRVLGAPSMEDANAVQGQAANEFGQANHFVTALEALGVDSDAYLGRDHSEAYRNLALLDTDPDTWPAFLATVGFADMATQVRLTSLEESEWDAVADPAGKAVQEEEFHTQYLIGAVEGDVVPDPTMTERFHTTLAGVVPDLLHWFGPTAEPTTTLVEAGVLGVDPAEERRRFLSRVERFVEDQFDEPFAADGRSADDLLDDLDWTDWNADRGRRNGGGPDAEAVEALRIGGIEASIGEA